MDRIEQLEQGLLQLARRQAALQVSAAALHSVQQYLATLQSQSSTDATPDRAGAFPPDLVRTLRELVRNQAELVDHLLADQAVPLPVPDDSPSLVSPVSHDFMTHAVIEAAVIGVVMIDDRGIVTDCNPAAQRIFGYRRDEVIGQNVHILMLEPERSEHDGYIRQYLQTGKAHIIGTGREVRGRRKDGTEIPLELAVSELRVGSRRSFVGMVQDITSLKQAERALRSERDRAESASRFKTEFLASMSHEIRTPMNGILGMSTLLSETQLDDEQQEYVQAIRSSAESLLAIINDILDVSKIEAGKFELDLRPFDLPETVRQIHQLFAPRAREKGLRFSGSLAPNVPTRLIGDPLRLRQVLVNLLGNAMKFTEQGSVTYQISVQQATDSWVRLRCDVIDTGVGIPHDQQQDVFGVFTQVRRDDGQHYGGTGLGLAISAKLVKLMGGRIWFESVPGRGTTFSFTAVFQPLRSREPAAVVACATRTETRQRPLKILLAEDNGVNRQLAERFLQGAGHQVTSVENGAEALRQIANDHFDVVLMDVQMPVLDGFAATKAIRQQERDTGRHLPIVAMTAHAMLGDRQRCIEAGMDDYVSKPIKMKSLLESLATVVEKQIPDIAAAAAQPAADEICDPQSLVQLVNGDARLLFDLVQTFLEDSPRLVAELQHAVQRRDAPQIASIAHTIKGVVCNFDAVHCHSAALALEQACRDGQLGNVDSLAAEVARQMHQLADALRALRSSLTYSA